MKYFRAFLTGIKENLSFRGGMLLHVINPIIFIIIMQLIWSSLLNEDYLDYFVAVMLLIPNFTYYSDISSQFNQSIKKGWDISFAKPINTFLLRAFYIAGKYFLPYCINFSIGLLYFMFFSTSKINPLVAIISIPFITLLEFSLAYLISLFSHLFYSIWGIRVLVRISDVVMGGKIFPLYLVRNNVIFLLPFANKSFFIADAILKSYVPLSSYVNLILWSITIIVVAYPFHRAGWKRFEAQGG